MYVPEDPTIRIILIMALAGLAFFLYKKGKVAWDSAKSILFTAPAFIATLLHIFIVVGAATSWVGFNTYFLGNGVQSAKK